MSDLALDMVTKIAELKSIGATWAQIASVLGEPNAGAAKAKAKKLAREAQQTAIREAVQHG